MPHINHQNGTNVNTYRNEIIDHSNKTETINVQDTNTTEIFDIRKENEVKFSLGSTRELSSERKNLKN